MESKRLDNAALAAGISPNYINAHGKPQSIGAETKRRLLDAMHRSTATKVAVTPVPRPLSGDCRTETLLRTAGIVE